jgi:hypothetical protein
MQKSVTVEEIQKLRDELRGVRERSLAASRRNDFREVARLTSEAARLNRTIHAREDFPEYPDKVLALVDALRVIEDSGHFEFPQEAAIPQDEAGIELPEAA